MTRNDGHERYMQRCIELARQAALTDDARVGSLLVRGGEIVGEGVEAVRGSGDVTAHAEIAALRAAFSRLGSRDLSGATLYTSVEPCVMCAYAIRLARVAVVVSGTRSPGGSATLNGRVVLLDEDVLPRHPPPRLIEGVLERECREVVGAV